MVGRSPETVKLLDVPPHVHQQYLDTSANMSQGFLVNAINIANQFDLGYKASRNQRLHVELALIKMCYLPSLVSGDEKKKFSQSINLTKGVARTSVSSEMPAVKKQEKAPIEFVKHEPEVAEIPQSEPESITDNQVTKGTIKKKLSNDVAKLGNLDDLLTGDIKPQNTVVKDADKESPKVVHEQKNIVQSVLDQAVASFVAKLKSEDRSIQLSLFSFIKPVVHENKVFIELIKQHKIQLEEVKVEFLQHLRTAMNHPGLLINIKEIKKKAEGTRAYTGQEKFDVMAKKNPALLTLRDKLNLTIK